MPSSCQFNYPSTSLSNGVSMPMIGLGTTHSGGYYHDVVMHALTKCGYRMIDTARRYGVEQELGIACQLSGIPRSDLFLCSKLWPTDYGRGVGAAFRTSCTKLQTEYLDLYMMHFPDVPESMGKAREVREDTWRQMELLYEKDLVRSIGVSNFTEADLEELLETCSIAPHVNQCEFHPWFNPVSVREYCTDNKILFTGYCPIAKGRFLDDPVLDEIAWRHGKSPAQICLRWSVEHGVPVIPKSAHKHRVKENTEIFDFSLTPSDIFKLETLSTVPHKIVQTYDLQQKFGLPDGYKLQGRVYGVPRSFPTRARTKSVAIPNTHFQAKTLLMSP